MTSTFGFEFFNAPISLSSKLVKRMPLALDLHIKSRNSLMSQFKFSPQGCQVVGKSGNLLLKFSFPLRRRLELFKRDSLFDVSGCYLILPRTLNIDGLCVANLQIGHIMDQLQTKDKSVKKKKKKRERERRVLPKKLIPMIVG